MGQNKPALKAQKAIKKLNKKYKAACKAGNKEIEKKICKTLDKAEVEFAREKYYQAYKTVTGKQLRKNKKDKGVVVHALNGVTLEIEKGEMVAIMGPSGSGKSTLLNALGLIDDVTSGKVYVDGVEASKLKPSKLPEIRAKKLGFVFQSYNLIPTLSALDNVILALRYSGVPVLKRKKIAEDALRLVKLGDRMHHTPNELSGGQRQRVAIARSLVNEPAVIFGDELTGELDTKTSTEIMNLLIKLNRQKKQTFIIVTHNPEVAKMCQRTIKMRDGQIVTG
ncbi:ABC transporter ATP-binding protein [Patescibacteria group bacterium]|nr:ABC transporter ATP-binding protein [Patescibacteria group bacterium]